MNILDKFLRRKGVDTSKPTAHFEVVPKAEFEVNFPLPPFWYGAPFKAAKNFDDILKALDIVWKNAETISEEPWKEEQFQRAQEYIWYSLGAHYDTPPDNRFDDLDDTANNFKAHIEYQTSDWKSWFGTKGYELQLDGSYKKTEQFKPLELKLYNRAMAYGIHEASQHTEKYSNDKEYAAAIYKKREEYIGYVKAMSNVIIMPRDYGENLNLYHSRVDREITEGKTVTHDLVIYNYGFSDKLREKIVAAYKVRSFSHLRFT